MRGRHKLLLWIVTTLAAAMLLPSPTNAEVASWYGPGFHGRTTANGETYNQWARNPYTAAHKSLAFGTLVRVSRDGRSVVVCINDRGPFIAGRDLDLNRAAADALDMIGVGVARVSMQIIGSRDNCR